MLAPLLLLLLAVPLWQAAELRLGLRGSPRGTVSPAFLSLTLDASLAREPRFITLLSNPKLHTLARGLSPGFLRFGGTSTDFLIFDPHKDSTLEEKILSELQAEEGACGAQPGFAAVQELLLAQWPGQEKLLLTEHSRKKHKNTTITGHTLDILHGFANCSGFHLVFGLNALLRRHGREWDSSNAGQLLGYCARRGYNLSWELGNEPNSFKKKSGIYIDGSQLGRDFIHLRRLLSQHPLYRHAKLYGPDVGQPRKHTQRLLRSFLKSGGKVIDSVTWHHYYVDGRSATREDFLSPAVLDTFATAVRDVLEIVAATVPGKKVWLGETSSAYGGGAPQLSNTYLAGFMWLDKLGLAARQGIDVVMRQVFFGAGSYHLVDASFEPLPDYWLSLLYKRLVGTRVLEASVAGADARRLRVYLHCTNPQHPKYREGDVTLFALNLYNVSQSLQLPKQLWSKQVDQYLLLPHGKESILSRARDTTGEPGCNVARVPRQEGAAERPPAADGGQGNAAHAPRGCPGPRQRAWPARLLLWLLRDQERQGNRVHLSAQGAQDLSGRSVRCHTSFLGWEAAVTRWSCGPTFSKASALLCLLAHSEVLLNIVSTLRAQQAENTHTVFPFLSSKRTLPAPRGLRAKGWLVFPEKAVHLPADGCTSGGVIKSAP
ncbi:heparanase isoform X1 [Anser cygnoides]|uniref:heparanase isoform X1 n=1 Tax=Anser cygnoides TaxID=8845 RepID=UPI0034D2A781